MSLSSAFELFSYLCCWRVELLVYAHSQVPSKRKKYLIRESEQGRQPTALCLDGSLPPRMRNLVHTRFPLGPSFSSLSTTIKGQALLFVVRLSTWDWG